MRFEHPQQDVGNGKKLASAPVLSSESHGKQSCCFRGGKLSATTEISLCTLRASIIDW